MVVYQLSCCCKPSYIGLITRYPRKIIIDQIQNSVEMLYFPEKKDDKPFKVLNESKRLSNAEQLVNNSTFANSFNLNRYKVIKT